MKVKLNIDVHYWNKETNYLFDFNFSECEVNNINTTSSGSVLRNTNQNELLFVSSQKLANFLKNRTSNCWSQLWLIHFLKDQVSLIIPEDKSEKSDRDKTDKTYLTVKHTFNNEYPTPGYKIKVGDQLKFGKLTLICKEMKIYQKNKEGNMSKVKEKTLAEHIYDDMNFNDQRNSSGQQLILRPSRVKHKKQNLCRICYSEEIDYNENPLIAPCKCSGTMRYIHLECLRDWLKSKIVVKTYPHMASYAYKKLECELCTTPFPFKIKTKVNSFNLINMNLPESTYAIFEQVVKEENDKMFYVVMFKDSLELKVGRSNESDVRLSDISISRYHANLHVSGDSLYINDNDSKFGTLLLVNYNVNFILNQPIGLQIGKHFVRMEINKTFLSSLCCNK